MMSGQTQRLIESAEIAIMKVIVSFQNELDTRAAEITQSDDTGEAGHTALDDTGASDSSSRSIRSSQPPRQRRRQAGKLRHSLCRRLLHCS